MSNLITRFSAIFVSLLLISSPVIAAGKSAIEQALESIESLSEADQKLIARLNIRQGVIDFDGFVSFVHRIQANPQLEGAITKTSEEGISTVISSFFITGPFSIHIDSFTLDDDVVIRHLHDLVDTANAKGQLAKELEQPAEQLGVRWGSIDIHDFDSFIQRALMNSELKAALQEAKKQGVEVYITFFFKIRQNSISIDHRKSDDEIIASILGKEE